MKILFIGDIYGEPGFEILKENIDFLKDEYRPNLIVVNAENVANGRGITEDIYKELMKMGIHAITMGNWTWGNNDLYNFIEGSKIIRPANYRKAPGLGYQTINYNGKKVLIVNLLGRIFMNPNLSNPFIKMDEILENNEADYILVDMHAEATSEKVALGHYLDGRVSAVVGTHTHIQTNDNRVLPKGTLYISDVGMTGPLNGVIGVDKEIVLERFITGFSKGNITAKGAMQLNGVIMDLDKKTIEKIHVEKEVFL